MDSTISIQLNGQSWQVVGVMPPDFVFPYRHLLGPSGFTRVTAVGNDLQLDPGIGTCGKDGQSVPVGVGIPTIKISHMTVGGTAPKGGASFQ